MKKLFVLILSTLYFVLSTATARADSEFATDVVATYKVDQAGKTTVSLDTSLENVFPTLYATSYTLTLDNINIQNVHAVSDKGVNYTIEQSQDNSKTNIKVDFSDAVVGRGAKRNFSVSYDNSNFALKTGEVWEISIPRLSDSASFRNYKVNLVVPDSFGEEAYISPNPSSFSDTNGFKNYSFGKNDIAQTGITAGFGQFQVFTFNLTYPLENSLPINSYTQFALPPDTSYQRLYYQSIDPKPNNVQIDEDGNWIATYNLGPRQRLDVKVVGAVQIFSSFRPFPKTSQPALDDNLGATNYWQVNDNQIKALAESLKTPENIYNYVTATLKYDYSRVQPNVKRLGAIGALQNANSAICMEFTDLFIAIARAAGIPAREIIGYAYTDNPQLQPLSLVADVLHAWPEYYDKNKDVWIPIDPTWGETSKVDYFNKFDLRHFAFVIDGGNQVNKSAFCQSSNADNCPYFAGSYKFAPNPQKDVFVSFGQLPSQRNSVPQITVSVLRSIPFLNTIYSVNIYNPGPAALYNFVPSVYFDNTLHSEAEITLLPPFASYTFEIDLPFNILGKGTPDNIMVAANESHSTISTNKTQVVINSLLIISVILIFGILAILAKLGKISIPKLLPFLKPKA